jgi:hypothetical protein
MTLPPVNLDSRGTSITAGNATRRTVSKPPIKDEPVIYMNVDPPPKPPMVKKLSQKMDNIFYHTQEAKIKKNDSGCFNLKDDLQIFEK